MEKVKTFIDKYFIIIAIILAICIIMTLFLILVAGIIRFNFEEKYYAGIAIQQILMPYLI